MSSAFALIHAGSRLTEEMSKFCMTQVIFVGFFGAAPNAQCLFCSVQRTIEEDLPIEPDCLRLHDLAVQRIMNTVETPDWRAADFVMVVRQSGRSLSRRRR